MDAAVYYRPVHADNIDARRYTANCLLKFISENQPGYTRVSKSYTKTHVAVFAGGGLISCDIETVNYNCDMDRLIKKMRFYLTETDIRRISYYDDPHKYAIYAWTRKECLIKAHNKRNVPDNTDIVSKSKTVLCGDMMFVSKDVAANVVLTCYCPHVYDVRWVDARV